MEYRWRWSYGFIKGLCERRPSFYIVKERLRKNGHEKFIGVDTYLPNLHLSTENKQTSWLIVKSVYTYERNVHTLRVFQKYKTIFSVTYIYNL